MTEPLNPEQLAEVTAAIYSDLKVAAPTTVAEAVEAARESAASLLPDRRVIVHVEQRGATLGIRLTFPLDEMDEDA